MKKEKTFYLLTLIFSILLILSSCKKEKTIPEISTSAISEITEYTAKSGGTIIFDGNSKITAMGVCWSTSQNPTVYSSKTIEESNLYYFTSNLHNLVPNTTYYVRAYATNSEGTGYGETLSFTTQQIICDGCFLDSRDGNIYKTITIGNQTWMAENLKYLPSVVGSEVGSQTVPYYYVFLNESTNVDYAKTFDDYNTYGVLYNWPAAMDACPTEWHLPTEDEWTELINYLGGEDVAADKLKEIGISHWDSPNADATNESGFTALPGGWISYGWSYGWRGTKGFWWSATEYATNNGVYYSIYNDVSRSTFSKSMGFSVRCIKD